MLISFPLLLLLLLPQDEDILPPEPFSSDDKPYYGGGGGGGGGGEAAYVPPPAPVAAVQPPVNAYSPAPVSQQPATLPTKVMPADDGPAPPYSAHLPPTHTSLPYVSSVTCTPYPLIFHPTIHPVLYFQWNFNHYLLFSSPSSLLVLLLMLSSPLLSRQPQLQPRPQVDLVVWIYQLCPPLGFPVQALGQTLLEMLILMTSPDGLKN